MSTNSVAVWRRDPDRKSDDKNISYDRAATKSVIEIENLCLYNLHICLFSYFCGFGFDWTLTTK